jgi:glycosyltransferase involved in cell wall biosynthesis
LIPVVHSALRLSRPRTDAAAAHTALLRLVAQSADCFDVIHCHTDWLHLAVLHQCKTPFLTTLHGRLDIQGLAEVTALFPHAPFVSISNRQREPLPDVNWIGTIAHGLPENLLTFHSKPDRHLVFLGRISPEKGADVAVRIARAAGMPLRLAAKVPGAEQKYFREKLKPLIDDKQVRFVGEIGDEQKSDFLGDAAALLFPIDWPEPFGLVLIEAMACGTPSIAFRRGAVPEIVENGVTGFVVDTEGQAVEAVGRIGDIDRAAVRRRFEERFTARRMAADYLQLYASLIRSGTATPSLGVSASAAPG